MQALREELDAANKRIDRYVHLVASLSEELDNLRRSICSECRSKFVPKYAPVQLPVSSKSHVASSSIDPRPSVRRRIVSGPRPLVPSSTPSSTPTSPNPEKYFTPLQTVTVLPSPPTPAISVPQKASSFFPSPALVTERPEWSVKYNPDINQTLRMNLANTFEVTSQVFFVKFSPDGKYLGVGVWVKGSKTYIFDVEKGSIVCSLVDLYPDVRSIVWGLEFSPDSKCIATASSDRCIRLWNIAQKRMRAMFQGHRLSANTLSFSPNGRFLVSGDGRGAVRVWSLRDGSVKKLSDDGPNIFSLTFSPDGRHIACLDLKGCLRIWNARTGHLLDEWRAHVRDSYCLTFSPDGKGLVSGGEDKKPKYWDVSSLAVMETGRGRVIDGNPGQRFPHVRTFQGHTGIVRSIFFSPDNRWVATSSQDTSVRIWDPYTAEWQCTLNGHNKYARTVAFSPKGKYLATGSEDGRVRLWRYST